MPVPVQPPGQVKPQSQVLELNLCCVTAGLAYCKSPSPAQIDQVPGSDLCCLPGWAVVRPCQPRGTALFLGVAFLLTVLPQFCIQNENSIPVYWHKSPSLVVLSRCLTHISGNMLLRDFSICSGCLKGIVGVRMVHFRRMCEQSFPDRAKAPRAVKRKLRARNEMV